MIGISGAQANHAKKQTKNAIHVRWNARIGAEEIENRLMLVALLAIFLSRNKNGVRSALIDHQSGRTPLSLAVPPLDQQNVWEDRL
jgi:hypothetical protein